MPTRDTSAWTRSDGVSRVPRGRIVAVAEQDFEKLSRLDRLRAQVEDGLRERDLAKEGEERGDGHHHPAEAATDADQREKDLRDRVRWERRRTQLERALEAIEAGTYGICVDCGAEIPEGRLDALPDAERCVECQRLASRRR